MSAVAIFALFGLLNFFCASGLEFVLQKQDRCFFEEIHANVLVVGDWSLFYTDQPGTPEFANVKVIGPHGNVVKEEWSKSSGQFAFTAKFAGEYQACFRVKDDDTATKVTLKIDWKTGVAATDWSSIAKREHLDDLAVALRRMDDSIREVYNDLLLLQQREQEMRDISELTNTRVAWYSIFTLFICISCAVVQLWYLRGFFIRKKLM